MADTTPLSTSVPETVTTDTGADPESIGALSESFSDFWKEEDAKVEEAPSAPGPSQETKPETKKAETPLESTPEPVAPVTTAKEIADDDIDKFEISPSAREDVQQSFKNVKEMWKGDRAKLKAEAERAKTLETQLAEARQNSLTPEIRADYEHAAQIRRKFDFASDPEFLQKFHAPVRSQFESILEEAVAALPDRNAAAQWADYIKQNYTPDQLNRDWWLNSVIAKIPNPMDQSSVMNSVTQLLKMQKERDTEITRRTSDKSSFDNWITEKTQFTAQRIQEEIMSEIGVQEKRIQEVLPRNIEQAKTTEERNAIAAHNERFEKLNGFFKETMHDLSKNGPKAWVRASVEATRAMLLESEYKKLEGELKTIRAERDQYKGELDKITGARRKISHTTGTPPASSNNGKKQTSDGLSIKELDIRNSFKNFDWGDNT
jgi:hypoxanthine phosphoribosyltransferase